MKILMICYEYPPLGGGGGHVVYGLTKQLVSIGHTVDLLTMKYKGLPALEREETFSINRVVCIRTSPIICHPHEMMSYLCTALPTALKMARKNSYDIIHALLIFRAGFLDYLLPNFTGFPFSITPTGRIWPGNNPDRFFLFIKLLPPLG